MRATDAFVHTAHMQTCKTRTNAARARVHDAHLQALRHLRAQVSQLRLQPALVRRCAHAYRHTGTVNSRSPSACDTQICTCLHPPSQQQPARLPLPSPASVHTITSNCPPRPPPRVVCTSAMPAACAAFTSATCAGAKIRVCAIITCVHFFRAIHPRSTRARKPAETGLHLRMPSRRDQTAAPAGARAVSSPAGVHDDR